MTECQTSGRPAFVSGLVLALLAAAFCVAVIAFLPHCGGERVMRCVWMTHAAAGAAALATVAGLIAAFVRSAAGAAGVEVGVVLGSLLAAATPAFLIAPCPNAMMKCHAITAPTIMVVGVVLALLALLDIWRLTRRASGN